MEKLLLCQKTERLLTLIQVYFLMSTAQSPPPVKRGRLEIVSSLGWTDTVPQRDMQLRALRQIDWRPTAAGASSVRRPERLPYRQR